MPFETIAKPAAADLPVAPNIGDYEEQRASFNWEDVAKELDGLPGGGINIAYEAVDRHVAKGHGSRTAFVWVGKNGEEEIYTFEDLMKRSNQWCDALRNLGVKKGDRVFVFLDRIPELYAAVFGTLKAGCVIGPPLLRFRPRRR